MGHSIRFDDVLISFSTSILEKNNEEEVLWDLAKNCISKLGFLDCVIYVVDYEHEVLIQKAAYGSKSPKENSVHNPVKIALGEGISGKVAVSGKAAINYDTSNNPDYIIDDQDRLSEITVPIVIENTVYGVIDCEHPDKNFFTEQHVSMLSAIASFCSIKINSIRADKKLREEQENMLRVKQELVGLKLKAFHSQMNPHFVFNALNAIQNFITSENKKSALDYLSTFSKLTRFYLKYIEKETVHLVDEIDMLHWYLKLQKLRYGDQFDYVIDVEDQSKNTKAHIPSFILQIVLENSIEQAMYNQNKNYAIRIGFKITKDNVLVDISFTYDVGPYKKRSTPNYRKQLLTWKDQIQVFNTLTDYDIDKQVTFSSRAELNSGKIVLKLPNLQQDMSLKAIIIDDEKHSRETLKNLLSEFCTDVTIMASAGSVEEAIRAITTNNPDVVFLDIELQSGTGFDILTRIKSINFEIIFITAFEQYAIKAVKYSSLDYLLKPIDLDELIDAVEKAKKKKDQEVYNKQLETLIHNLQQQPRLHKICLSTADGFEFVSIENIIYCKANGSYTSFYLKNKKTVLVSKHLKEYENLLADQHFMRVHNSFLINLKEVEKYVKSDGGYILMSNKNTVNISKSKKDLFLNAMNYLQ